MSAGILFSQMSPPPGQDADFHDWYESEHIPARIEIDGFDRAIRYETTDDGPRFLAVYFLDDMSALDTPEYRELKDAPSARTARMLDTVSAFTRYIAEEISDTGPTTLDPRMAGATFVVAFEVPDGEVDEFEEWYEGEHVPLLMRVPGWLRVRRYRTRPGSVGRPWTHFALHEILSPEVLEAPEREMARNTARRDALATRDWFDSGRWVYRPIHYAFSAREQI